MRKNEYWHRAAGFWIRSAIKRPRLILAFFAVLTGAALYYSLLHFSINADLSSMISGELRFRRVETEFSEAFPSLSNNLVFVIDAQSADLAARSRDRIVAALKSDPVFRDVYSPGSGDFFDRNGLLFLDTPELEDFADSMASAQPLLALLSRDLTLKGLFDVLGLVIGEKEADGSKRVSGLMTDLGIAVESAQFNRPYVMPWQELMMGPLAASQRRQFVMTRAEASGQGAFSGETAVRTARKMLEGLGLDAAEGVRVRITGDAALNEENVNEVKNSVGAATVVSFALVALLLYFGLWRSGRLILASLATLLTGLILTTGFALAFIGPLNVISATFAVLFIGLGIDYSIQFCLRYRELIASGTGPEDGIEMTAKGIGRGLFLSCITTAIGFYAFLPTAYSGVAELGIIAGTGMFISFFVNLTVLPAILRLVDLRPAPARPGQGKAGWIKEFPYRRPRTIALIAAALGLGAAVLVPRLYFEYNPFELYDPDSEALITINELFNDPRTYPWTVSAMAHSADEAKALAIRLESLKEVKSAVTVFDLVPADQEEKLSIINDIHLFMAEGPQPVKAPSSCMADLMALDAFEKKLEANLAGPGPKDPAALRLQKSIIGFNSGTKDMQGRCAATSRLEGELLPDLKYLLGKLRLSLEAGPVEVKDLPTELLEQYLSRSGLYRVQVFPRYDIKERGELAAFVDAVYSVTPEATDAPVIVYESGKAVVGSFKQAVLYALLAIILVLVIEMRGLLLPALVLVPLSLAMLLTGASSVLLGMPLNFANVVVVPLLLGAGVHNGILFTLRYRTEPPPDGNMLKTSTARAAFLSLLTIMISTGSLAFSDHRGISSIGVLLTLCFVYLIFSTLLLLPALFAIYARRLKKD